MHRFRHNGTCDVAFSGQRTKTLYYRGMLSISRVQIRHDRPRVEKPALHDRQLCFRNVECQSESAFGSESAPFKCPRRVLIGLSCRFFSTIALSRSDSLVPKLFALAFSRWRVLSLNRKVMLFI